MMTFDEVLKQVLDLLQREGRVSYRALKRRFDLDAEYLEDLKAELIDAKRLAVDEEGRVLVWTGHSPTPSAPAPDATRVPLAYVPGHLAEKILQSRTALEGERKEVTVLFADLKGSLELLAERDPEESRALLDPVLERMIEAVHRYEGTVNQVMGDGIMALFGAPLAHEDHAVRACYAALRMQERVTRYGDEVQRSHGVPLQIRVGLNSGAVVVRAIDSSLHMDYTAVGQTTHLAARMEQMAKPGSVLVTAETLRLAEGAVQVRPLGPVPVKGLAHPMEVFELAGAMPTWARLQAAAARGLTRFVGRQAELEALRHAMERTGAGHGQLVAVIGEPGVGKTRLCYEFTRAHRPPGWLALESHSVSYGKATPYLPVRDLLKGYFEIDNRDGARGVREKVTGKLLTLDAALGPTLSALLTLLDVPVDDPAWHALDPPQRRQHTLGALKRLLLRESQAQPLLLVFENLQWIDAETQGFLDTLVESLPTARVLLLVNYRPEYAHGWGGKSFYTQLRLDPLQPERAEELLEVMLGDDPGLTPLKQRLIERTERNPFFLEESVRTLVEIGVLEGERGAYRLTKLLQSIQVPATVQAVLATRIDRLPPDEKRLLQAEAVIGTDVPLVLLQAIAAAQRALALATADGEVVVQALANSYLGRAYHAQGDYGRAIDRLGLTIASLEGAWRYERFGQLILPAVLARTYLAWCHAELGTFDVGMALGEEGLRIAEAVDHPVSLMWAYHGIGLLALRQGDLPRALPSLERAMSICRDADFPVWFPTLAAALRATYTLGGRVADAVPLLAQAMEKTAAMEAVVFQVLCGFSLGEAELLAGHPEEARALVEHALGLAREHRERGDQTYALRLLGDIAAQRNPPEVEPAETHYREALALADELGMRPLLAHCRLGLGKLYLKTGQREKARPELSAAIELYRPMDMTFWLPQAEAELSQIR